MRTEEVTGAVAGSEAVARGLFIEVGGRKIPVDAGGYLIDPADWSTEVAVMMAAQDGVELGDDHWLLIDFLNRFYAEFEVAPDLSVLARNLCKDQGDCRWTRRYIKELFPNGSYTACRYAGLPEPVRGCV